MKVNSFLYSKNTSKKNYLKLLFVSILAISSHIIYAADTAEVSELKAEIEWQRQENESLKLKLSNSNNLTPENTKKSPAPEKTVPPHEKKKLKKKTSLY